MNNEEEVLDIIDEEESNTDEEKKEETTEESTKEKKEEDKKVEEKVEEKTEEEKPAVIIPPTEVPEDVQTENGSSEIDEISATVTEDEIAYAEKSNTKKKIVAGILIFLLIVDLIVLALYLIGFDRIFTFIQ